MNRRDVLTLLSSLSATTLTPLSALAQGKYPERPIKLMVAFSAGGVNDVVARQWAERVKTLLGTVYVENQGGGTGTIATGEVARAPGDGYTILLGSTSTMVLNPMTMAKVPYDPAKDFVPIAILCVSTTSIVVHPSVPAKNLKELIAYSRANPGKLSYGSAGTGTMSNLSGELFKQLTGADATHVPYAGGAAAATDLIAGNVQLSFQNLGTVAGHIAGGRLRPIIVTSAERHPVLPEVPTAAEAGAPGVEVEGWNAMLVPTATPPDRVARLAAAVRQVLAPGGETRARFEAMGQRIVDAGPGEAAAFIRAEIAKWGEVVRAANIRPD
jgi:tripartite-type tricarboxylate transporter receptor subunit TctC